MSQQAEGGRETVETALGPVEIEQAGKGAPVLVVHGTPGGSDRGAGDGRVPGRGRLRDGRAAATVPGAGRVTLDRGSHLALWIHPEAEAVQARAIALLRA